MRFARVPISRATVRGEVAVYQSGLVATQCDGSIFVQAAKLVKLISTSKRYCRGLSQVYTGISSCHMQLRTGLSRVAAFTWPPSTRPAVRDRNCRATPIKNAGRPDSPSH